MDLARALRGRLAERVPYATEELLGRRVRVRLGTLPSVPGYDDGWVLALLPLSRCFFDVGCNVGFFSLVAAVDDSSRWAVLIDANPLALGRAAENLIINSFAQRSRFVLGFVSSSSGDPVTFFTVGAGAAGSRYPSHSASASAAQSSIMSRSVRLDEICAEQGLWPDLVKIDVEGAESEVLYGAERVAARKEATFLVEMHSRAELPMAENGRRVLDWCSRVGYDAYYLKDHVRLAAPEQISHRGRCHLLLIPMGDRYPDRLKRIPQSCPVERARELLE
jgi:FkbM family methyltransferase